jgi:phosphatidylinositol alpha-mannosyltransferase
MSYLKGASAFCAPSLGGESFGVVLLEAMAAGTPVVASALDGYMNVATHDRDSLLCEPGNVDALAAALLQVLDRPELADRLRAAGRIRAAEFSMTTLATRYVEIYEQLVDEAHGSDDEPVGRVPRLRAAVQRMMQ